MTQRLRKAWEVTLKGRHGVRAIYFAPTAAEARAKAVATLRDAWSVTWMEALRSIVACRRAPMHDVRLPVQHPLATSLPPKVLDCVTHAYGGRGLRAGYRAHYCTDPDDAEMIEAARLGLFQDVRREFGGAGGLNVYALTDLGKAVAAGEVATYPGDDQ